MFTEIRLIDWIMLVVEVLVLLLIAYEVIVGVRRKRTVAERLARLFQEMSKGQELQKTAPRVLAQDNRMASARWIQSAREWSKQTETLLGSYSAQAAAAFVLDTSGEVPPWFDSIEMSARNHYSTVVTQLNNLRGIMEKPDVYF